ncbi:MAG: PD-(D/E)XK nuclease family protein [Verrucomicrobiales bacterium]|nr:PD-(D/E)XK nuclease family protein [Verrucomicrobiales bacterium]
MPAVLIPSSQESVSSAGVGEAIVFGERIAWQGSPDPGTVGDAMHRIFAVEILIPEPDKRARLKRISDILAGFELESHLEPSAVAATVDRYRAFVQKQFSPISESVEVPFSYVNESGQRVSGFIDHLLETEAGSVILDHKIFPGKRDYWNAKVLSYSGQLAAYRNSLESPESTSLYVHLVSAGCAFKVVC